MVRRRLALLLFALVVAVPASAQLRYFGYDGGADDDDALARTEGYTNFAYIVAPPLSTSSFVRDRIEAMSQQGIKAIVAVAPLLWCGFQSSGPPPTLCPDWLERWARWKRTTAPVLSRSQVLGFAIFDEPFHNGIDMRAFEDVSRKVKEDFPWAKVILVEASCAVGGSCSGSFATYQGTLPSIDWVGIDCYGIHPASDPQFLGAIARLERRFPDRKRIYVLDGFWDAAHLAVAPRLDDMGPLAREWYDFARADARAILLGVFTWGPFPSGTTTSKDMTPAVLLEHRAIGRAITGKPQ